MRLHGWSPLPEPGDGELLSGEGCAWVLPGLDPEMCLAPELPRGMRDLILCVLSHAVWEGSSHPGLFVVSLSSPAQLRALLTPLEAGLRAQLNPLREGPLSQQSNYPKCQQEQPRLGPAAHIFCAFCFSSLLHGQKLLCPSWVLAALGSLQQLQRPACCQPTRAVPTVLLLPVQSLGHEPRM